MSADPDRVAGGIYGLLIGDALGVPYEFHDPEDIPEVGLIEFDPPPGFRRAHSGTPPGTWSDDGAQALCLLASLLEQGRLDPDDLAGRFLRWYRHGYMAVAERVFDVGITTSRAISAFAGGAPALASGPDHDSANGNGSLMRVLPLALWHRGTDEELARDAMLQSRVTHGHVRSQVCCALYCLWARRVMEDKPDPWADAVAALRGILDGSARAELNFQVRPDDLSPGRGSGYVVDCLRSARWAVDQGDYETVVKAAVALGHDTDTTACVAGGIAGLRDGLSAIPQRWRDGLREKETVEPLIKGLLG